MLDKRVICPGQFSRQVAADSRRGEFDCKNESLIVGGMRPDILFVGDSITHWWELQAYFGARGQLVINRGIGGDTSHFLLQRWQADVTQLQPKQCVLLVGINDSWDFEPEPWLWRGQPPISPHQVLHQLQHNLASMAQQAEEAGIQLLICSLLPTAMDYTLRETERREYILAANRFIADLCGRRGMVYVDYYSAMVEPDGQARQSLFIDGLHPNAKGYGVMAKILARAL